MNVERAIEVSQDTILKRQILCEIEQRYIKKLPPIQAEEIQRYIANLIEVTSRDTSVSTTGILAQVRMHPTYLIEFDPISSVIINEVKMKWDTRGGLL